MMSDKTTNVIPNILAFSFSIFLIIIFILIWVNTNKIVDNTKNSTEKFNNPDDEGEEHDVDAGMSAWRLSLSASEEERGYQDRGEPKLHEPLTGTRVARPWISRSVARTSAETPRRGFLGRPP